MLTTLTCRVIELGSACLAAASWAQAAPDAVLTGAGAGWASFGLAGLIMAWLFLVHLPGKDKQLKELVEAKDAQITALIEDKDKQLQAKDAQITQILEKKWAVIEKLTTDFKDLLAGTTRAILDTSEKQNAALRDGFQREMELLRKAFEGCKYAREGRAS